MVPLSSYAATYYASPAGSGTSCSASSPCSLSTAQGKLAGGDTLLLGDGTYNTTIANTPSGTSSAYTVIKAQNDGGPIIQSTTTTRPLQIGGNYIQIEGIKFVGNMSGSNTDTAYITGSYNKVLRSAFVTTPNSDSTNNTSNVIITGTYNLLEDCWAWGGGRYTFLLYGGNGTDDATYNILRRCVGRHDRDASTLGNAVFTNYQGKNNLFQNCIALDSNQDSYYGYWHGAFFLEKGQKGGSVWIKDSIALNYSSLAVHDTASMDYSGSMFTHGSIYVSNMIAWKGGSGFETYYDYGGRVISLDHSTFGAATGMGGGDWGGWALYAGAAQNSGGIATNNIFNGWTGGIGDCGGANDYNAFYANGSNRTNSTTGAHDMTSVNPLSTALLYLPRIEAGSPLKGAGANGSDIGATVMYKRGVSGTLYGQTGYDTVTTDPLWPWPNEARIKADMSKYPSNWPSDNMPNPVRGFTSGTSKDGTSQSLTKYIWEFLGHQMPSDVYGTGTTSGTGGGTLPTSDTTAPTVSSFTIPTTATSLTVPISSFSASDNTGVTGYCVTTTDSSSGCTWSATPPTSVTFPDAGAQNAYAWAKDGSNNISQAVMDSVTITLPTQGTGSTSTSSTGKTYYVRPDGHDGATGLSNSSDPSAGAWLTLQQAANTVAAGDTVNVADGTYKGFMIQTAGTATSPITFHAIGKGANITTPNAKTTDGINIESYSSTLPDYIVIDGFNISGQPRMGIRAIGGKGIVIKNNTVYNSSDCGIFSGDTPGIQVLNNTTYKNGSNGFQHNIYISNALSDNCVVRGNIVYSANAGNGIQLNGDWQDGGDGYITGALVENNIIYNNYNKGLSLISVQNGIFRNNIIYGNGVGGGAAGIHLVDQLGQNFSSGNVVVNNTIDEPRIACVRINSGSTNNVVFNNITIGPTGVVFEGSGNYQSNNYSGSTSGLFASYSGHDYHLVAGSPAIDYGVASYQSSAAPIVDIIANARPQGNGYDAGAYEYGSSATAPAADTTKPVISAFAMPAYATSLTVPVSSFTATDNVAVTGYLVTESSTVPSASATGWSTAAPVSYTFSAAGSKTAYAWAKDAAGNISNTMSAAVSITLPDITSPTVSVSNPVSGATVSGTLAVSATASDNVGVAKVEFYLDGALKSTATATPYGYSWDTTSVANGTHTVSAKAYDAAGNVGQSTAVSVTVNNTLATPTPTPTTAPIAFVQAAAATPQSASQTVAVTYPKTQTAGNTNIVVVGWNDTTSSVQSIKDSAGNVYTLAAGPVTGTGLRQSIYYASGIKGGANSVTVTFSAAASYPDIRILEYSGIAGVDKYAGASGSGTTANSGSITTTSANALIFGANMVTTTTSGAGTGFTSRIITSPDSDIAEDRIVSSTGTYSATASLGSSGNWIMQTVAFAGGAAQSSTVTSPAPSTAPIAFVQVASTCPQSATQSVSVSYPYSQKAGNMNVVVVGWNDTTNDIQSVTDSAGNVYSLAAGTVTGSGLRQAIYYAKGIVAATNKVTVNFSGAAAYPDIRIAEYSGLSGVDSNVGASGSSSTCSSGSLTTTAANTLLFSANTVSTGTTGAGTGFTSRVITSPDSDIAQDRTVTSTGTYSATAPMLTSGNWVMQLVSFK